jgi:hypothetical protein
MNLLKQEINLINSIFEEIKDTCEYLLRSFKASEKKMEELLNFEKDDFIIAELNRKDRFERMVKRDHIRKTFDLRLKRKCEKCGRPLSMYNPGTWCHFHEHDKKRSNFDWCFSVCPGTKLDRFSVATEIQYEGKGFFPWNLNLKYRFK